MSENPTPPLRVGVDPSDRADELFAPPTKAETASVSPIDGLRAVLAKPVETEPVTLRVPGRKGLKVRFHTRMTQEQRKGWQSRARTKKRRLGAEPEVDDMLFGLLVIANTCEAILVDDVEATDVEGTPLTFAHRQVWEMVGADDPQDAIRRFYGVDAHVLLTSGEILLASGFDDDLSEDEGPTRG